MAYHQEQRSVVPDQFQAGPSIIQQSLLKGVNTYLLAVVEALVVVVQSGSALLLSSLTLTRVHNVASKDLLPEGVAAAGT